MIDLWDRLRMRSDDRYLVLGDSGCGKSFYADRLRSDYQYRYNAPALIVDSKPDYAPGRDWHRKNPGWSGMKDLPDAILVTDPDDLRRRMRDKTPHLYVVQGGSESDYPRLLATAAAFYEDSRGIARVLHVDETMDFFHANGSPKGGIDILRRTARSARSRNCGIIYCAQRTKGFHPDIRAEMSKAAFFAMLDREDRKIGARFGIPIDWPEQDRWFQFWTRERRSSIFGPFRLRASQSSSSSSGTRQ